MKALTNLSLSTSSTGLETKWKACPLTNASPKLRQGSDSWEMEGNVFHHVTSRQHHLHSFFFGWLVPVSIDSLIAIWNLSIARSKKIIVRHPFILTHCLKLHHGDFDNVFPAIHYWQTHLLNGGLLFHCICVRLRPHYAFSSYPLVLMRSSLHWIQWRWPHDAICVCDKHTVERIWLRFLCAVL